MTTPILRITVKLNRRNKNAPLEITDEKIVGETDLKNNYWPVLIPFLFGESIDEIANQLIKQSA